MPRIPGLIARHQQPLYDTVTITPKETYYEFFKLPLSACEGSVFESTKFPSTRNKVKTLVETNMDQGGSLPYPKNFEIHSIGLHYDKTVDKYELENFKEHSSLKLFIGTKDYLNIPVGVLDDLSAQNRGSYVFAETIDLIPQQNFYVSVKYEGDKKADNPFRLRCVLQGFFRREVQ